LVLGRSSLVRLNRENSHGPQDGLVDIRVRQNERRKNDLRCGGNSHGSGRGRSCPRPVRRSPIRELASASGGHQVPLVAHPWALVRNAFATPQDRRPRGRLPETEVTEVENSLREIFPFSPSWRHRNKIVDRRQPSRTSLVANIACDAWHHP